MLHRTYNNHSILTIFAKNSRYSTHIDTLTKFQKSSSFRQRSKKLDFNHYNVVTNALKSFIHKVHYFEKIWFAYYFVACFFYFLIFRHECNAYSCTLYHANVRLCIAYSQCVFHWHTELVGTFFQVISLADRNFTITSNPIPAKWHVNPACNLAIRYLELVCHHKIQLQSVSHNACSYSIAIAHYADLVASVLQCSNCTLTILGIQY